MIKTIQSRLADDAVNFQNNLATYLPAYYDGAEPHTSFLDNYMEAAFELAHQCVIEDFAETVAKALNAHILYIICDKQTWEAVIFSNPFPEELFVIELTSDLYGVTKHIKARFYASIEVVYEFLEQKLNSTMTIRGRILERMSQVDFIKIFF